MWATVHTYIFHTTYKYIPRTKAHTYSKPQPPPSTAHTNTYTDAGYDCMRGKGGEGRVKEERKKTRRNRKEMNVIGWERNKGETRGSGQQKGRLKEGGRS